MSTSKHIDKICLAVCILMLLLAGLLMAGRALGIGDPTDADAPNGQFTANDLNADWDRSGATRITLTGAGGSVRGGGAYIDGGDVHILYAGAYILSGELTDGSVIIEAAGSDKLWILLDGVSLHCDDSAAFVVEQAQKVFLTLADGTENSISSGGEYRQEVVSSGIDGALYSRDDLTINGSGSLRVAAAYRHGIVCNDDLVITGGSVEITAAQDGIHAHDSARLANAELLIYAGDDSITVSNNEETGYVYVESGSIRIPSCYEGIEAVDITIAGGTLDIRPTDDGINACGRGSNSRIRIAGGDITIINETGRDADGLDSNGSIEISGGELFISVNGSGTNTAIDYGSENGGICTISGGTVIAAGSSRMAEGIDSSSEQGFLMYTTDAPAQTTVTLKNAAGQVLLSQKIPCSFSFLVLSAPALQLGERCTISVGGTEEELLVDNTSSGGFGMAGMFGGQGGRGEQPFGGRQNAGVGATGDAPAQPPQGAGGQDELPEMPGDLMQQGEGAAPGALPDGDAPGSEVLPGGDAPGGEFAPGDLPGGDEQGRDEMPFWEQPGGQTGMGGGQGGGRQFMQGAQAPEGPQGSEASEPSTASPGSLALVGVSILFLLAGIFAALKVKH